MEKKQREYMKKYMKDWRAKNREKYNAYQREYHRKYMLTPEHREKKRARDRILSRKYREEHPEWKKEDNKKNRHKQAILIKRWEKEHPEIMACYRIYQKALRDGILIPQPCVVCGSEKVHGHHERYDRPLEVDWLCPKDHKAVENGLIDLSTILVGKRQVETGKR